MGAGVTRNLLNDGLVKQKLGVLYQVSIWAGQTRPKDLSGCQTRRFPL